MDGFRLDAVPYLYEREGTNGENLPETHAFLAELRDTVDREFPNRVLLCEANQWPEDVIDYFGTPKRPECHMNFHFPLMPRLFMALRRESREAIVEILARTPAIGAGSQWGIFLRNHDELTLEMVTLEERDYMWAEYARDPRMKLNLGIRRRLAPLLDNGTDKLQLFFGLLLSLPGTPILYYGDEIGMGDNIFLQDRDGVRTPMQWTSDRNAGFSRADFEQLYLPPLMDPVYGYQAVNVESQQRDESGLLHWLRHHMALRREWRVFGEGSFEVLYPANLDYLRVRSHIRRYGCALCEQPLPLCAAGGTGFAPLQRAGANRDAGRGAISPNRRASLPVNARRSRLLLVQAQLTARSETRVPGAASTRAQDPSPGSNSMLSSCWVRIR